jgi:hypothetical protein
MKFISQETSSLQCRCRSLKESLFSLLERRNVKTCTEMQAFCHLRQRVGPCTTNVSPHPQDRIPDMEGRKLNFSAASGTAANIICQEGAIQNQNRSRQQQTRRGYSPIAIVEYSSHLLLSVYRAVTFSLPIGRLEGLGI